MLRTSRGHLRRTPAVDAFREQRRDEPVDWDVDGPWMVGLDRSGRRRCEHVGVFAVLTGCTARHWRAKPPRCASVARASANMAEPQVAPLDALPDSIATRTTDAKAYSDTALASLMIATGIGSGESSLSFPNPRRSCAPLAITLSHRAGTGTTESASITGPRRFEGSVGPQTRRFGTLARHRLATMDRERRSAGSPARQPHLSHRGHPSAHRVTVRYLTIFLAGSPPYSNYCLTSSS